MLIPADRLSPQVLDALVEEFITREGTDYGSEEINLKTKLEQLKRQIFHQQVLIVFDEFSETTSLMTSEQYQQWLNR